MTESVESLRDKANQNRLSAAGYEELSRKLLTEARELEKRLADLQMAENAKIPVDHSARVLASGKPVTPDHAELKSNGQQKEYVVLSEAERSKGFVRPVRFSYVHVGRPKPNHPLRDLTAEERVASQADNYGYVKYEAYPESERPKLGRYWTQKDIDKVDKGCGALTTMGRSIAETYARSPSFYGSTFCCGCGTHLPVGEQGEFVWDGTEERVGT